MAHGIIERNLGFTLPYSKVLESAGPWESLADITTITIKRHERQNANMWVVGEKVHLTGGARAHRDLGSPGTAYHYIDLDGKVKSATCMRHISQLPNALGRYDICTIAFFAFHRVPVASDKPSWEFTTKLWVDVIMGLGFAELDFHLLNSLRKPTRVLMELATRGL